MPMAECNPSPEIAQPNHHWNEWELHRLVEEMTLTPLSMVEDIKSMILAPFSLVLVSFMTEQKQIRIIPMWIENVKGALANGWRKSSVKWEALVCGLWEI